MRSGVGGEHYYYSRRLRAAASDEKRRGLWDDPKNPRAVCASHGMPPVVLSLKQTTDWPIVRVFFYTLELWYNDIFTVLKVMS